MKRNRPLPDNKPIQNQGLPAGMPEELVNQVHKIQHLSALVRRSQLFGALGQSYQGDRDLYESLGWTVAPTSEDFRNIYKREGMAKRVNNAPCDAIWNMPPEIHDEDDLEESPWEKAINDLIDKHSLWSKCNRADKLLGFGPYSILLLGTKDVESNLSLQQPLQKTEGNELLYVQVYAADNARITSWEKDAKDPRFGMPLTYEIDSAAEMDTYGSGGSITSPSSDRVQESTSTFSSSVIVHWSRVIHILEGNLENEIFGEPRLLNPYNRLKDIQKIVGGSGEMFWRGALPGRVAKIDKDTDWDEDSPDAADLRDQMEEYEHNLRRWLQVRGVSIESLAVQIASPKDALDAQIQDLSAGQGIPKRILTGSELGELASSEDRANWMDRIDERRAWFAEPVVIRPIVDRLIEYGFLDSIEDYIIAWKDLRTLSDKEKAEIGEIRSKSLKNYGTTPDGDLLVPPEQFDRYFLGLNDEQVQEIRDAAEEALEEEAKQQEEDAKAMEEEAARIAEEGLEEEPPEEEEEIEEEEEVEE